MAKTQESRFGTKDAYTEQWLSRCHPTQQKRWVPLLRAMTAEELKEFHAYRLERASRFQTTDETATGDVEREEAERFLFGHWQGRLSGRRAA